MPLGLCGPVVCGGPHGPIPGGAGALALGVRGGVDKKGEVWYKGLWGKAMPCLWGAGQGLDNNCGQKPPQARKGIKTGHVLERLLHPVVVRQKPPQARKGIKTFFVKGFPDEFSTVRNPLKPARALRPICTSFPLSPIARVRNPLKPARALRLMERIIDGLRVPYVRNPLKPARALRLNLFAISAIITTLCQKPPQARKGIKTVPPC